MFLWFPLATSTKESSGLLWDKMSSRYTQLWHCALVCPLVGEKRLFHSEELLHRSEPKADQVV